MILAKIQELASLQAELRLIESKEMKLRLEVSDALNKGRTPGTYYDPIGPYRVKNVLKYNYRIDKDVLEGMWDTLDEFEREAIRFTPSIVKKQYDLLDDADRLNECISVSPATPTISIEDIIED